MKKKRWIWLGIGSIILWASAILCCLLITQLGSEYQIGEELLDASEEAYRFDPTTILSSPGKGNVFTPIPFPDDFTTQSANMQIFRKQEEYFQVLDLFMQNVLNEPLQGWKLNRLASSINCIELTSENLFLQSVSIWLFRETKLSEHKFRQDLHLVIAPEEEMIRIYRREYYPYEILDYIEWSDFTIPVEQAILIADQQGGAVVRTALNNECEISAVMTAGIQKSDWRISYSPTNKPSVFEVAVDEKTGKYRILREFGK